MSERVKQRQRYMNRTSIETKRRRRTRRRRRRRRRRKGERRRELDIYDIIFDEFDTPCNF